MVLGGVLLLQPPVLEERSPASLDMVPYVGAELAHLGPAERIRYRVVRGWSHNELYVLAVIPPPALGVEYPLRRQDPVVSGKFLVETMRELGSSQDELSNEAWPVQGAHGVGWYDPESRELWMVWLGLLRRPGD
jgi:hypothetical protein